MKIQNPTNGFVRVESNDYVLVCDPWLSKGIFDGAWMPYPAIVDEGALLDGVTHSFISHIHEDHYDVATLDKLSRDVHLLVPDVYPNHLMAGTLKQMGFRQPSMLALEQSVEVAPGCLGAQLAISVHNCPLLTDSRFPMSIFKRTQRKYVKKAYRVRNWREYEAGLRNRGSLTVWISLTAGKLVNWDAPRPRRRKPGPSTQVLEPRHRDGCHPGHGVSSVI